MPGVNAATADGETNTPVKVRAVPPSEEEHDTRKLVTADPFVEIGGENPIVATANDTVAEATLGADGTSYGVAPIVEGADHAETPAALVPRTRK